MKKLRLYIFLASLMAFTFSGIWGFVSAVSYEYIDSWIYWGMAISGIVITLIKGEQFDD